MPGTPTTRYQIPTLAGTTLARSIDNEVNDGLTAIDSKMVGYSAGTLAARPTSTGGTPRIAGRRYRATDTGQEFIDTGTGWVEIAQYAEGLLSARPAAGLKGRIYRATDSSDSVYYIDNGTSWDRLPRVRGVASTTWNPPSVVHASYTATVVNVSGALPGDPVIASLSSSLGPGLLLHAHVMNGAVTIGGVPTGGAAGDVLATIANLSGSTIDPASGTLNVVVLRV